ncbi:Myosinlike protein [Phytophthora megakarya]|uniref:Myosinlike protein n=1 Tax=Phytophthora megakarya TaxID=4795 RepID=A0A225WGE1_9STRA|nr:Myosinlike protein [Phytophthora megakarya]
MMPRRLKYAPHLGTISETATIASLSKEKESPIAQVEEHVASTRSKDARIERSNSAPPEAEASDRRIPPAAVKRGRSLSAKCLSIQNLKSQTATETRETSPTSHNEQLASPTAHKSNKYGRSSLHNAVRKGDKHAIKKILEMEPELLYKADSRGNHPLHYAASPNVPDGFTIVYMLMKAGASVNALNDRQQTPLLISVISNDNDDDKVPRILLFHHAKPMIKVTDDLMLAQYASSRGLHKIAAAIREYM